MNGKRLFCLLKAVLPAVLAALFLIGCSGASETKVVVRLGEESAGGSTPGVEITEDCYRYICMKNMVQYFGEGVSEKDLTDDMKATLTRAVEQELRSFAAIEILAQKEGVELSSPEESQVRADIQRQKLSYATEDEFGREMEGMFLNEHVLFLQLRNEALEEKLYDKYAESIRTELTGERLRSDIETYCYAASQILLISENAKDLLENLRANITDAESFYERAAIYSVDSVKGVRVCIVGEMVEEYEKAALALEPGQISDVIVSSVGGHIILREELTDELISENLDDLREKDIIRIFREKLASEAAELTISYESGGKLILK